MSNELLNVRNVRSQHQRRVLNVRIDTIGVSNVRRLVQENALDPYGRRCVRSKFNVRPSGRRSRCASVFLKLDQDLPWFDLLNFACKGNATGNEQSIDTKQFDVGRVDLR